MQRWPNACQAEQKQFRAISVILAGSPELVDFLFDSREPKLNDTSENLLRRARGCSRGDYLLIKLCLDIWCEQGKIQVHELFELDRDIFISTLRAFEQLVGA